MVTGVTQASPRATDQRGRRFVRRFDPRALARTPSTWIVLCLSLLSMSQLPGKTTLDTKLGLTLNPAGFLAQALHLWNPQATSGELQNQAYGYLFPMGPYFVLCDLVGLPAWISQRLWCALLLSFAFGGALLLARAVRIGTEPTRLIGAVGYALAPRMLTEIGTRSAEMLPTVLLPWVLLPLVTADRIGSPRRAAGLSAIAVLFMGGVNASMVVMALVLPGLWLLSRTWTKRHFALVGWWCGFVIAAALWWILPLLVLGRYSLPFLDYIESSTNTTAPMSLFQVLRGTNQWVAYVVGETAWWPAGWALVSNPFLMVATGLVAAVGLFGLAGRGLPERRFVVLGTLTGLTLMTVGYVGTLDSPIAETARNLLDGPLAPLRNVHKFEPVLRLPLMLAFIHAISGGLSVVRPGRWTRHVRPALGAVLVVVVAAPAWLLMLRPGPGWDEVPGYWDKAMHHVAEAAPHGRTLLLPATGFAEYTWGRTVDEPARALAESPWAVRNQVPLGSEGNTRLMDVITRSLSTGRGHPGLADLLARSGFTFLLLRNDIDRASTDAPAVSTMHAGISHSPGIVKVAEFGPPIDPRNQAQPGSVDTTVPPVAALELYKVKPDTPLVTATNVADVPTVSGGPGSLPALTRSGMLSVDTPTILAGDGGSPRGPRLVTDGLRKRARNFGRIRGSMSQTLTSDEKARHDRAARDILPFRGEQHQTIAVHKGIRSVAASTAVSYADAFGRSDSTHQPFAAIDGNPNTAWHSSSLTGPDGQWLEVDLTTPRSVQSIGLSMVNDLRVGWSPTKIRITTDNGSITHRVDRGRGMDTYAVPPGLTRSIRVTVLSVLVGRQDGNVGIAELRIPGVDPERALRVPSDLPPGPPPGFAFTRGPQPRYACHTVDGTVRCDAGLARRGEEPTGIHRLFSTPSKTIYEVGGTVLPAFGGRVPVALPNLTVASSSQLGGDPAASGVAAVDDNSATAWIPAITDLRPALNLRWRQPRNISGLRLDVDDRTGATLPTHITVTTTDAQMRLTVGTDGTVTFPPVTTDRVKIELVGIAPQSRDGVERASPGIGGVEMIGAEGLVGPLEPATSFTVPCGSGPRIELDGAVYQTSVQGTLSEFMTHETLPLTACGYLADGVSLAIGDHELRTTRTDSFAVQDLWLRPTNMATGSARHRSTEVLGWQPTERTVTVGAGERAVLSVPENANKGWVATLDGEKLEKTRVDGWQQAWIVPAGNGGVVELRFVADEGYRTGMLIGGITAVLMLLVTAIPIRHRRTLSVRPAGATPVSIALIGLLAVLAGMLPLVLLVACLLLRQVFSPAPRWLAFTGMVLATGVSVLGKLLGHGQEWAYSAAGQAGLLVSAAAIVAVCIEWFHHDDTAGTSARHRASTAEDPRPQAPPAPGDSGGWGPDR